MHTSDAVPPCAVTVLLLLGLHVHAPGALAGGATCNAPGWVAHDSFDPVGCINGKKPSSTKTCSDCLEMAAAANHSVYAWNHESHHCYSGECAAFGGTPNPRVQSGCQAALAGCSAPTPGPAPAPPPTPAPPHWPPPGPAVFVPIEGGSATIGRACPDCVAGAVMDDPKLQLIDGYLSYDEMPPRQVTLRPFSIMAETVSAADFSKSGLPGSGTDASHETASAYAAWLSAQPGEYSYRLPTEAEWEATR